MYEEIITRITEILKSNTILQKKIKKWYFGAHDITKPDTVYPFVWVALQGGPMSPKSGTHKAYEMTYQIVVAATHGDEDRAEKAAMGYAENIDDALTADPTLKGSGSDLVGVSYLTNLDAERVLSDAGSFIVGIAQTLYTRKIKT